jgi:hypothetical protein
MKATIKYDNNPQQAAEDMESYISPKANLALTDAIGMGASYALIEFCASFQGVEGYPVKCWYKETKELYATY